MREKIRESEYCELRTGCQVTDRVQSEGGGVVVTYRKSSGAEDSIRASWLVGADGKKGVVRKHFLEPESGIRQVEGSYRYEGLWIATNLRLKVPTCETHPDFPLWKLGYVPKQVYNLFWPFGFHFASPPGKPTASGRFGPYHERLWRHEFAQHDWHDGMDPEALLWEHLTPMITRSGGHSPFKDDKNKYLSWPCGPVAYPLDCIEVTRCRPFRFAHKVVNRWFEERTILIGDAAHVFPPFGGQGIACGVADAHQLAWRLFLLQRLPKLDNDSEDGADRTRSYCMLGTWASEREQGVQDAAAMTRFNGQLCNVGDSFRFWLFRTLAWLSRVIPFVPAIPHPFTAAEKRGISKLDDGFFLPAFGGGGRVAQIPLLSEHRHVPVLSDRLLGLSGTVLTLLVLGHDVEEIKERVAHAKEALRTVGQYDAIVSEASIKAFCPTGSVAPVEDMEVFYPCIEQRIDDLPTKARLSPSVFTDRFRRDAQFVLVRDDFYIFAQATSQVELVECLDEMAIAWPWLE